MPLYKLGYAISPKARHSSFISVISIKQSIKMLRPSYLQTMAHNIHIPFTIVKLDTPLSITVVLLGYSEHHLTISILYSTASFD